MVLVFMTRIRGEYGVDLGQGVSAGETTEGQSVQSCWIGFKLFSDDLV